MSIKVRISGKDSTTSQSNKIEFYVHSTIDKEKVTFFLQNIEKEVINLPISKQKKWKKSLLTAYQTCLSLILTVKPAAAASHQLDTKLIPTDLLDIILQLEILAVILGVALANITFVGAGIYRILRKEKVSREWSVDIIKGLVQILIAPVFITTIIYIISFLFGNSEWYINPLEIFSNQKNPSPSPQ